MKFGRIALVAVLLLSAVAIMIALASMRPEPPQKEPVEQRPLVEVRTLTPTSVSLSMKSQGGVAPRIQTELSAEVAGPIIAMSDQYLAGGVFKANQTLLTIDPTNYRAALTEAEATLEQRRIEYEGVQRLGSKGYRSETELAAAEAQLERARADVVRARRNLDKTQVRLPYAGLVRAKSADLGQFVAVGSPLGRVFATDVAQVRLPLTANDLRFVRLPSRKTSDATPLPIELTGQYRGKPTRWPAQIVRTEGVIDPETRVTFAVAEIDDPYALKPSTDHAPLPIGTFVEAIIPANPISNVAEIPRSALRGNDQVVLMDSDRLVRIDTVDVIYTDDSTAWIDFDSLAFPTLILTTLEAPVNGLEVRVVGAETVTQEQE